VLDDMNLAWNIKRAGLRLVQVLGNDLLSTRMYMDWDSVRAGFAKNILAGHGGSLFFLLLSTLFHWSLFVLPWAWLGLGWAVPAPGSGWPLIPAALVGLGLAIRMFTAALNRDRVMDGLLMPVSVWLMTVIAFQAVQWHWQGTATWKGRRITNHE